MNHPPTFKRKLGRMLLTVAATYGVVQSSGLIVVLLVSIYTTTSAYGDPFRGIIGLLILGLDISIIPTVLYALVLTVIAQKLARWKRAYTPILIISTLIGFVFVNAMLVNGGRMTPGDLWPPNPGHLMLLFGSLVAGGLGGVTAIWVYRRCLTRDETSSMLNGEKINADVIGWYKTTACCYGVVQLSGLIIGLTLHLFAEELFGGLFNLSEIDASFVMAASIYGLMGTAIPTAVYAMILGLVAVRVARRPTGYKIALFFGAALTIVVFFIMAAIYDESLSRRRDWDPGTISMVYSSLLAGGLGSGVAVRSMRRHLSKQETRREWA